MLFIFLACSGKAASGMMSYDSANYEAADYRAAAPQASPPDAPTQYLEENIVTQDRKLVKNADIRLRVEDPAATEKSLSLLMKKFDAWPASTGIYENSRNYVIRVPSGFYEAMLAELTELGRVLWRTENTEDVTLRYYDLESRLTTKRELLRTYQSYLGKANNIDEIMTVESRIADLQREIDQTGTQFRNLANLVDYSTISVEIDGPISTTLYSKPTLKDRLGKLFASFGDVTTSALVALMGIVIYGVPAILIAILLFAILFGRIGLLKKLIHFAAGKKKKEIPANDAL